MVPTEKALAFLPKIRALLPSIEVPTHIEAAFEPSQSTKSFTIASPDHIAPGFLGEITAPLRREASNCTLVIRSRGPDDNFERALLRVEGDIAIGNSPSHRDICANTIPYRRPVVCLMREGHPLDQGSMSEGADLFAAHIMPVSYTASYRDGVETISARCATTATARRLCPVSASHPVFCSIPIRFY